MKIVLNRDVKNLGKVGDIVVVKDGYGRNFLIPKGYAIVATKNNVAKLQEKIETLKKQNELLFSTAKNVLELLDKQVFNVVRQAADDDTIYGSIRNRDIYNFVCDLLKKNNINFSIDIGSIKIAEPIKSLGQYLINIELFSGVDGIIRLNVCRAVADFEEDVVLFDKKREKSLMLAKDNKNNADKVLKSEISKIDEANKKEKGENKNVKENTNEDVKNDNKELKDEVK